MPSWRVSSSDIERAIRKGHTTNAIAHTFGVGAERVERLRRSLEKPRSYPFPTHNRDGITLAGHDWRAA